MQNRDPKGVAPGGTVIGVEATLAYKKRGEQRLDREVRKTEAREVRKTGESSSQRATSGVPEGRHSRGQGEPIDVRTWERRRRSL